jgi:uncharacterized phage infection (PIP) family protein YhgE
VDDGGRSIEKQHLKDDIYYDASLIFFKNEQSIGSCAQSFENVSQVELREIEKRMTFYEKESRGRNLNQADILTASDMRSADFLNVPAAQNLASEADGSSQIVTGAGLSNTKQQKSSRTLGKFSERFRELKERLQDASDQLARAKWDIE